MTVAGIEKQQIARAQGEFLAAAGKAALAALDKAEDVMLVKVGGKGLYDALEAVGLEMQLVIIDRAAALVFYAHPSLAGLLYHCGGEMACTISSFLQRKNEVQTEQFRPMGKDKRQKLWYTARKLETTNLKKTGAEEMTAEKLFEHQGAILLAQSDGCAVWQFRNETGDGTMTTYEIFSGVMLAFNDFRMERYRMQNSPESKAENPFTDVKADAYYANAVLWAVENGVTTGASATTFDPAGDCTRGQIVTFLYRCLSK